MAKALTVRQIECLRAEPRRREIPDGLLAGLYLVVQPSGAKSWAVRYRHWGRPRKLTLGSYPALPLGAARSLARRALVAAAEGKDPCKEKRDAKRHAVDHDRDRFEKIASQFVERHAKANTRESSWRETLRLLNRDVIPVWRGKPIQSITRRDVIELLDGIADRGSPIMANRVLAAVRRLFGWCVDRGILEVSPCSGLKAPAVERSRDRVLADEEVRLLWRACDEIGWPFGPLVRLLILTGQRRDEVSRMRWSVWTIPRERSKNDAAHEVPLSSSAVAILTGLPKLSQASGFVFTTTGNTPVGGFSRAKDRLNARMAKPSSAQPLLNWTFHDLRRTAASGMARLGINLAVIEKVLNHRSGTFAGIVGVYQRHSFSEEKRQALEAWGAFIERLRRPPEAYEEAVPADVLHARA